MKQFRSFSGVRLFLLASLFLASCGEQTELEQPGIAGGETVEVTQEIQINVLPIQSVGGAATRSAATDKPEKGESIGVSYNDAATTRVQEGTTDMSAAESKISNAYIVQFNGTGPDATVASMKSITSSQLSSGAAIAHTFVMKEGVKNRVYVVANVTTVPVINFTKLSAFEAPINYTPTVTIPTKGLPMSAHQDVGVGDAFDVFQLRSVLAKLTFKTNIEAVTLKLKCFPSGYSFNNGTAGDVAYRPSGMTYNNKGIIIFADYAYYVPENLSGRNDLLIKHYTRALGMAPANAMYVEINNDNTIYNLLLGDGTAQDFNFVGGYTYNINATIYDNDAYDLRVGNTIPVGTAMVDMNASGETANCYVATAANTWYMFNNTVMGNGAVTPAHTKSGVSGDLDFPAIVPSKLNPSSADVLWESDNTATVPDKGVIVNKNIYLLKDRILFKSGSTAGNAVIAAKDASNNILWSWHIWRINDTPAGVPLASITNGADFTISDLTLMDRNLGALRATPNAVFKAEQDYGLYYQWGRKDPFQTQGTVTTTTASSSITPADAVKSPTTFYIRGDVNDWTTRNDNLWGCPLTEVVTFDFADLTFSGLNKNSGSKSIYDPCPVGWKVMPAYTFANATKENSPWNTTNKGRNFAVITTSTGTPFFIPASGSRSYYDGSLSATGTSGDYWTSTPYAQDTDTYYGCAFNFAELGVYPVNTRKRTYGRSVRCVRN